MSQPNARAKVGETTPLPGTNDYPSSDAIDQAMQAARRLQSEHFRAIMRGGLHRAAAVIGLGFDHALKTEPLMSRH
ncbi:MAG: hypothetical protein AAGE18_14825 [Pseudomonadota bacterium]